MINYIEVIDKVNNLLDENLEWVDRYAKYAEMLINDIKNVEEKDLNPQIGRVFDKNIYPIGKYSSISRIKSNRFMDIRYKGRNILQLETNKKNAYAYFWDEKLNEFRKKIDWTKDSIKELKLYAECKISKIEEENKNHEYVVESSLKSKMLEKPKEESFKGFVPVRIPRNRKRLLDFQMPTPLSASDIKTGIIKYSGHCGGGIDLLARSNKFIKKRDETTFCVIEIKDSLNKNEEPVVAIKQTIAYATFIGKLLRTNRARNDIWYSVFRGNIKDYKQKGYKQKLDKPIEIRAIIAMPLAEKTIDLSFDGLCLPFNKSNPLDKIILGYMDLELDPRYNVKSIKNMQNTFK